MYARIHRLSSIPTGAGIVHSEQAFEGTEESIRVDEPGVAKIRSTKSASA